MVNRSDPKEKKILVVDDDESVCSFLKTLLEKENFIVESAYDGEEALKIVYRE
jgi:CheY-like chemotaxis protein